MSISDISPIGLPQSLKYDQLPSISDSVTSYSVSVVPSGLTTVGPVYINSTATPPYVVNTGTHGFLIASFISQSLDFQIPSGQNDNIFLDTRETTVSFRMTIVCSTAWTIGTSANNQISLIGSGSSFFDSMSLFTNNVRMENI